jgi:hypothetical protein
MKLSSIVIMNSMSSWVIEAALLRVDILGSFTAQLVVDRFEKFGRKLRFELARSSHTAQPQSHLYRLPEFFSDILLPASSKPIHCLRVQRQSTMGTGKKEAQRKIRQGKVGDGMGNVKVKGENFYR